MVTRENKQKFIVSLFQTAASHRAAAEAAGCATAELWNVNHLKEESYNEVEVLHYRNGINDSLWVLF